MHAASFIYVLCFFPLYIVPTMPVWIYIASIAVVILIAGLVLVFGIICCRHQNKKIAATCCESENVSFLYV